MGDQTFSLRSMALKVYSPSLLYSVGLGAVTPIIAISARDRGASIAMAALIVTLVGVGSLISNVPAALLTNKVGERTAMVAAAGWAAAGLALGLFDSELAALRHWRHHAGHGGRGVQPRQTELPRRGRAR